MKTETLINALRILALDIQSDDGVANSVVAQAANELEDLVKQRDELLEALEAIIERWDTPLWKDVPHTAEYINAARIVVAKAKGEK